MMRRFARAVRAISFALPVLGLASCGPRACGSGPAGEDATPTEPARLCGKVGLASTPLPPLLAAGGERVGSATLKPGDKAKFGRLELEYDPDSWIGTMEVGGNGPALMTLIDRREADGGPWGAQEPLVDGQSFVFDLGPYRFEGRAGAGTPPATVAIAVVRKRCPPNDIVANLEKPMWTWLSTDAIQLVTFRPEADMVQVSIAAYPAAPGIRIEFSSLLYRCWIVPEPGKPVRVQGPGYLYELEEIVPGPGTRFEGGAWRAEGQPTAHARIRIEPVAGKRWDAGALPEGTSRCGAPVPGRAALPAGLAEAPSLPATVSLAVGGAVEREGLELSLSESVLPPLQGAKPKTFRHLALRTADGAIMRSVSLNGYGALFVRLGELAVRIGAQSVGPNRTGELRAEIVRLACPHTATAALAEAPATMWLSTRGLESVVLTVPGSEDQLGISLSLEGDYLTLSVSAPEGQYSFQVRSEAVGRVFELGGARFEIAAVETSGDTRFDGQRWTTTELVPAVHVAVIVAKIRAVQ